MKWGDTYETIGHSVTVEYTIFYMERNSPQFDEFNGKSMSIHEGALFWYMVLSMTHGHAVWLTFEQLKSMIMFFIL